MKVALTSDVHLEFGQLELTNDEGAEVLILSGDILVERDLDEHSDVQSEMGFSRKSSVRYHTFFQNASKLFKHVVYVAGNHEHYHGDFKYTLTEIKKKLAYLENVHVLDKETFEYGDYIFVGGTLWTDMNKEDPLTLHAIRTMMNDFRCVKNSNRYAYRNVPLYEYNEDGSVKVVDGRQVQIGMKKKEEPSTFCPEDAVEDHKKMVKYLEFVCQEAAPWKTIVVVGHHAPSRLSTHPRYAHEDLMNGGYSSSLDEFIMDHPQIKLWTHGHTHEDFDYMIGETRVVCNPRGYIGHESRANNFKLKYLEV